MTDGGFLVFLKEELASDLTLTPELRQQIIDYYLKKEVTNGNTNTAGNPS